MMSLQGQDSIALLKGMQQELFQKLAHLDQLNQVGKDRQQKQYVSTFLRVMDRMGGELSSAQQHYCNIDREIEKDPNCMELALKLSFFRNQALILKEDLEATEAEIQKQEHRQAELVRDRKMLEGQVFQKSKQIYRYRTKILNLHQQHQSSAKLADAKPLQCCRTTTANSPTKRISFSQSKEPKSTQFTLGANKNSLHLSPLKIAKQVKLNNKRKKHNNGLGKFEQKSSLSFIH